MDLVGFNMLLLLLERLYLFSIHEMPLESEALSGHPTIQKLGTLYVASDCGSSAQH
jgi:hypothetical protein